MIVCATMACYLACLTAGFAGGDDAVFASAVEVRRFSFETDEDQDYDLQPDDWSRRRGPGFPQYVRTSIDRQTGIHGRQSLRVELNGGQVAYYSQPVPVDDFHAYVLRGRIRTAGMRNDAALVSISLLDHTRQRVRRFLSRPVTGDHPHWATIEIGPFRPGPECAALVLGCHIAQGSQTDVRGEVWFDDLWIGKLPLLETHTTSGRHYFAPGETVEIESRPLGLVPGQAHRLRWRLEDGFGQVLAEHERPLTISDDEGKANAPEAVHWSPPAQRHGYYKVLAWLDRDQTPILKREVTFVVMEPAVETPAGEFGWSLSSGTHDVPLIEMPQLAASSAANWLKLPAWSVETDLSADPATSQMTRFLDELERRGISLVGLLSDPPRSLTEKFVGRWNGVSEIFTAPRSLWYPSLEPVIAKHSFRIKHWQLGAETDDSFVGLTSLAETIRVVQTELERIGHPTRVGLPWRWDREFPSSKAIPHGFLSLSFPGVVDDQLLSERLSQTEKSGLMRWVLVQPMPVGEHPDERATDLARQMLAAKLGKADAIFATDPFDARHGLLHPDGAPTEMFLPWRTMAETLRGATHLGSFETPESIPNVVFARQHEVIVVLWSQEPVREEFYFGEQAYALDLWGRPQRLAVDPETGTQSIEVGPVPVIVRGCSEAVARWRLAVKFERGRIPSEFGAHEDAVLGRNTFRQGINGKVRLNFPRDWDLDPGEWDLQVGLGEDFRLPTLIAFPSHASVGTLRPSVDFEIFAERIYRFAVPLPYQLGLDDVTLQVTSRRTPDGRLEVEQRISNQTSPLETLDFNCSLFIPGRVRERQVVTRLSEGEDRRVYILPRADALHGKELWLRAEQIDGRRVLNFRWKVDATAGSEGESDSK